MDTAPTEWSFETWLTLGMVVLGLWVIGYAFVMGETALSGVGVAFIVLSLFLWAGRPSAYE